MTNQALAKSVFVGKSAHNSMDSEVVPPFFLNGGRPIDSLSETNYRVGNGVNLGVH
jgi:hypothetical protein